jgi:flagellar basal-body rod protein FlgC
MKIDRFFSVFKTASEGMSAQRRQLQVSAENIANANTSRVQSTGDAYKPKMMVSEKTQDQKFRLSFLQSSLPLKHTRDIHIDGKKRSYEQGGGLENMAPDTQVVEQEKFRFEYDPAHPDADENGMVKYPDLDLIEEMTNMVTANRLYEANLSVVEAEKQNIKRAFELG